MSHRDYIKQEIDTLPDVVIDRIWEFITFQKYSMDHDKSIIRDLERASLSSMGFWDNPDDEVWNNV